jgi:hypothetical protein
MNYRNRHSERNPVEEPLHAYIFNEGAGEPVAPTILSANKNIVKYRLDQAMVTGKTSRNARCFDWGTFCEGLQHPRFVERLRTKTLFCEIGHPPIDPSNKRASIMRQLDINRENSASMITKLNYRQPDVGIVLETLATVKGKDLKGLITENGSKIAYSVRSLGDSEIVGGVIKPKKPYMIITWDDVVIPSVEEARLTTILNESAIPGLNMSSEYIKKYGAKIINEAAISLDYDTFMDIMKQCSTVKAITDGLDLDPNESKVSFNEDATVTVKNGSTTVISDLKVQTRREVANMLGKITTELEG